MQSGLIYYVLFVGGIMFVTLSSSGLLGQYVWPDQPWMSNVMIPISTLVMLSTATLFYGYLFGIDNNESPLLKNIRYIIMGLVAAGLVAIAVRQYEEFMPLFSIVVAVIAVWLAFRSIGLLRNHAEEARWLLAGWG